MTRGDYSLKGKATKGISVITAPGGHSRPFSRGPLPSCCGAVASLSWPGVLLTVFPLP